MMEPTSMIDEEAVANRRNFPSAFETAKKKELRKIVKDHIPDSIYGLAYGSQSSPNYFYVGITNNTDRRWQQHLKAVANPADLKEAYVAWRDIGIDRVFMVVLDPTAEFTEKEWVDTLTDQGHILTNVADAVDVKRKKKKVADLAAALKPQHSPLFKQVMKSPTKLTFVKSK